MASKKRSTGGMAPPKHLALRAARRGEAARRANEAGEVRLPYMGKMVRMVRLQISTPGAMAPMVPLEEEEEDKACVLMLLYMCPYSLIHVSLCFYPCVLNPNMHVSL